MSQSATTSEVTIYSNGIVHCSVCAPKSMPPDDVEREVSRQNITGLDHGWKISDEPLAGGEPNPCPCNSDPERVHYLMEC